jgi:hypothetical protein
MKFSAAVLILILFFFGCSSKQTAELPAESSQPTPDICPKPGDEPVMKIKTEAGAELFVCGFEDHEVISPTGKRAFSDFVVTYSTAAQPKPQKLFGSQVAETFWVKAVEGKGLELEEVWFFAEQPKPAIWREIVCSAEACTVSDAKCVFSMKANPFPKALKEFEKKKRDNKLSEEGEELLDQIWAQALLGDLSAQLFYQNASAGLDENLTEVFESNRAKLADLKNINCR